MGYASGVTCHHHQMDCALEAACLHQMGCAEAATAASAAVVAVASVRLAVAVAAPQVPPSLYP